MTLLTFDQIIQEAHRRLRETEDVLRSPWRTGFGPNDAQSAALDDVREHIAIAEETLLKMVALGDTSEAG